MCIIAVKQEGLVIDDETIEDMWEANSDGAGFMYSHNSTLIVVKGLMNLDDFKNAYKRVGDLPAVLHFRIATHGEKDAANTHPFRVTDRLAMVHNGIISDAPTTDKNMSDTWNFCENIVKPMATRDGRFLERHYNLHLLYKAIGGSKLAFMNNRGDYTIINEKAGDWVDGVWFSNNSYKRRQKSNVISYSSGWGSNYSSYLEVGDHVKVLEDTLNQRTGVMLVKGEVGQIAQVYNNGFLRVTFRNDGTPGREKVGDLSTFYLHEDRVAYVYMKGQYYAI